MGRISQVLYSVFRTARRGLVPAPTASDVSSQRLLRADGAWADQPTGGLPSQTGNASKLLSTDGTNAAWRTISETPIEGRILAGDVTRTVAPYVLSDGATANRAGVATLTAATDPKTRTIQIYGPVQVPTSNPSVPVIIAKFGPNGPGVFDDNALSISFAESGATNIYQIAVGSSNRRTFASSTFRSTYSGRTVALSITIYGDSTTNPVVYADGVDISSSFTLTTAGTVPNWLPSTLAATYYLTGYNWPGIRGPVMEYGFGAWSAAEVATWAQTGVTPSWWASATGSAVVRYTSNFSAGTDGWLRNTGDALVVVSGNVDGIGGRDDCLAFAYTGAGAASAQLARNGSATPGQAVEVVFDYFAETGAFSSAPSACWDFGFFGMTPSVGGRVPVVTGSWQQVRLVAITASTGVYLSVFSDAASGNTTTLAAGKSIWLRNITVRTLGPAARWVYHSGRVLPDISGNKCHLVLMPGMQPVTDEHFGCVPVTGLTASGEIIDTNGTVPLDAVLDDVTVRNTSANTVYGFAIGSASGGDQLTYRVDIPGNSTVTLPIKRTDAAFLTAGSYTAQGAQFGRVYYSASSWNSGSLNLDLRYARERVI